MHVSNEVGGLFAWHRLAIRVELAGKVHGDAVFHSTAWHASQVQSEERNPTGQLIIVLSDTEWTGSLGLGGRGGRRGASRDDEGSRRLSV